MQDQGIAEFAALAGRADSYHGYIYVIEFSDLTVKVGRTNAPRGRIGNHRSDAAKFGIGISRLWVSEQHLEFAENERQLIAHAAANGSLSAGAEYFTDCDFDAVSTYASSLPMSRMSQDEISQREAESEARARSLAEGLFGSRDAQSSIPPLVAVMFMPPEYAFPNLVDMTPDDSSALMEQMVRMSEVTGEPVDKLLDENYIDMMGRVAKAMVQTQTHMFNIWAIDNGRDDLLATYRALIGGAA